ncbi:cytochrome C [Stappia sp. GBMRC 2046]|uniref:Cytochrome C n=1 Tax=Stappia sediminis TaxID=2692190 RepID=A0A7X3LW33_9HYPH|nr:cytochrome c [Stappia sediminis]MXN66189.1 cytochrome C [Stappia sediminis]
MKKGLALCSALAVVFALGGGVSYAHKDATGIVKERMDLMSGIAKSMKSIAQMVKSGEVDAHAARAAGKRIAEHASEIASLFPEGSIEGDSEATPAIWENFEDFSKKASALQAAAQSLADTPVDSIDRQALAGELQNLGGACKSCHETYRQKKG